MANELAAFYAAGRAIGLMEIGRAADVSLSDAPAGTLAQVRAIDDILAGKLPIVADDGADLLPVIAGMESAKRGARGGRGPACKPPGATVYNPAFRPGMARGYTESAPIVDQLV